MDSNAQIWGAQREHANAFGIQKDNYTFHVCVYTVHSTDTYRCLNPISVCVVVFFCVRVGVCTHVA